MLELRFGNSIITTIDSAFMDRTSNMKTTAHLKRDWMDTFKVTIRKS